MILEVLTPKSNNIRSRLYGKHHNYVLGRSSIHYICSKCGFFKLWGFQGKIRDFLTFIIMNDGNITLFKLYLSRTLIWCLSWSLDLVWLDFGVKTPSIIIGSYCEDSGAVRSPKDNLPHPAQLGLGHVAAGSPLLTSPNLGGSPNLGDPR